MTTTTEALGAGDTDTTAAATKPAAAAEATTHPKPGNALLGNTEGPHPAVEPSDTDPASDDTEPTDNLGKQAANFRRRLRETEAERDALTAERDGLTEQIEQLRRREVEGIASREHRLVKPEALWKLTDSTAADLLADDGTVDPAKVAAMVADAVASLGLATTPRASLPPSPNAGREAGPGASSSWGDFFKSG